MDIVTVQVGGDVAKDQMVVCVQGGKTFKVRNYEEALRVAAERLPKPCEVHLERSGGYERLMARIFGESGIQVRLHNPLIGPFMPSPGKPKTTSMPQASMPSINASDPFFFAIILPLEKMWD